MDNFKKPSPSDLITTRCRRLLLHNTLTSGVFLIEVFAPLFPEEGNLNSNSDKLGLTIYANHSRQQASECAINSCYANSTPALYMSWVKLNLNSTRIRWLIFFSFLCFFIRVFRFLFTTEDVHVLVEVWREIIGGWPFALRLELTTRFPDDVFRQAENESADRTINLHNAVTLFWEE